MKFHSSDKITRLEGTTMAIKCAKQFSIELGNHFKKTIVN